MVELLHREEQWTGSKVQSRGGYAGAGLLGLAELGGRRHGVKTSRTLSANTSRTYVFKGFKVVYPLCQPNWFSCQQPLRAIATGLLMRKPIGRPYDGQGVFIEVRRHKVSAMSWHQTVRDVLAPCRRPPLQGEALLGFEF